MYVDIWCTYENMRTWGGVIKYHIIIISYGTPLVLWVNVIYTGSIKMCEHVNQRDRF